jgi:hypothetical protein
LWNGRRIQKEALNNILVGVLSTFTASNRRDLEACLPQMKTNICATLESLALKNAIAYEPRRVNIRIHPYLITAEGELTKFHYALVIDMYVCSTVWETWEFTFQTAVTDYEPLGRWDAIAVGEE